MFLLISRHELKHASAVPQTSYQLQYLPHQYIAFGKDIEHVALRNGCQTLISRLPGIFADNTKLNR